MQRVIFVKSWCYSESDFGNFRPGFLRTADSAQQFQGHPPPPSPEPRTRPLRSCAGPPGRGISSAPETGELWLWLCVMKSRIEKQRHPTINILSNIVRLCLAGHLYDICTSESGNRAGAGNSLQIRSKRGRRNVLGSFGFRNFKISARLLTSWLNSSQSRLERFLTRLLQTFKERLFWRTLFLTTPDLASCKMEEGSMGKRRLSTSSGVLKTFFFESNSISDPIWTSSFPGLTRNECWLWVWTRSWPSGLNSYAGRTYTTRRWSSGLLGFQPIPPSAVWAETSQILSKEQLLREVACTLSESIRFLVNTYPSFWSDLKWQICTSDNFLILFISSARSSLSHAYLLMIQQQQQRFFRSHWPSVTKAFKPLQKDERHSLKLNTSCGHMSTWMETICHHLGTT